MLFFACERIRNNLISAELFSFLQFYLLKIKDLIDVKVFL